MDDNKVVFENKQVFNLIDWDKEIAKENAHRFYEDTILKRLSMALNMFTRVEQSVNFESAKNDIEKANMARLLQYFYAKYVYYHAHFYKKSLNFKVDLKRISKNSYQTEKNFLNTKFTESYVDIKILRTLERAFRERLIKAELEEKIDLPNKTHFFNQVKDLFSQLDLKVTRPWGRKYEEDRDTVCIRHKGIPYHISMMRESPRHEKRDLEQAKKLKDNSDEFIERYHSVIKRLYLEIKKLPNMKKLWVMEGGGMQHQAFFGNERGYIGILYLGMKGEKEKENVFTFTLERKELDNIMKNWKIEGIKVRTYKSVWGNK